MINKISIKDFYQKIINNNPFILIDSRQFDDFKRSSIELASNQAIYNIPFSILNNSTKPLHEGLRDYLKEHHPLLEKNTPIYCLCYKGNSSQLVTEAFNQLQFEATSIVGGIEAYNSHLEIKKITIPGIDIFQFIRPSRGCLSYLIVSDKKAVLIDPINQISFFENFLINESIQLIHVFDTHIHADHISSGRALAEKFQVPYGFHPFDAIHPIDLIPAPFSFTYLHDGQIINFGKATLQCLHLPGHTLGNLAFMLNDQILFAGDTIFIHGIARPDLGGKMEAWAQLHYQSLNKILSLLPTTTILPAHFHSLNELNPDQTVCKTLEEIKKINPELLDAKKPYSEFIASISTHLPIFPPEYIEIKRINLGISKKEMEEYKILECGKNLCAVSKNG